MTTEGQLKVCRDGKEMLIPLGDARPDEVFFDSGVWWQLCTTPCLYGQIAHGQSFLWQHQWYSLDASGGQRTAQPHKSNMPFGEPYEGLPFELRSDASVDLLDLKLAELE